MLAPSGEAAELLAEVISRLRPSPSIADAEGAMVLAGRRRRTARRVPLLAESRIVGWMSGGPDARALAALFGLLARKEQEQRKLADELLETYRELNLLYGLSAKLAEAHGAGAVARAVLEEARRLVPGTDGSLFLWDEGRRRLRQVAGFGEAYAKAATLRPGEGLLGDVLRSGKSEAVSDVPADPRRAPGDGGVRSLAAVAVRGGSDVVGLLVIASAEAFDYTAAHLRRLAAVASQAAPALAAGRASRGESHMGGDSLGPTSTVRRPESTGPRRGP
jgi:hypothetical protein